MEDKLLSVDDFAAKIKEKYPAYKDMDNMTLATKIVEKYPAYEGKVDLKKKDISTSVEEPMVSDTKTGSLEPSKKMVGERYGTFSDTGEKNTWLEEMVGKNTVTDFFGDMWRAGKQGLAQGATIDDSIKLLAQGSSMSKESLDEFIKASKELQSVGMSDEMKDFNKIYEKEGGGVLGFIKGVAKNPSVVNQLFISSLAAMFNPTVAAGAATGGVLGAGTGAALGSVGGPLAAVTALGGGLSGLAAGASGTLEAGLSVAEFLQDELNKKGLEFDNEGIKTVLEDDEALQRIRNKSAARGLVIGAIDGITAGLASKVGTTVGKAARAAGRTKAAGRAALAATGIEAVGGGVGETAARLATGQEMDVAEIGFETITGTVGAPLSATRAIAGIDVKTAAKEFVKPSKYKVNDSEVSREDVEKLVDTMSDEEIAKTKFEVENNDALKKEIEDRKKKALDTARVLDEVPDNYSVDDKSKLVDLEIQREKLSSRTTKTAKDQLKLIDDQIEEINKKYAVQEPSAKKVDVQEPAPDSGEVGERDTKQVEPTEEVAPEKEPTPTEEKVQDEEVITVKDEEVVSLKPLKKHRTAFEKGELSRADKIGILTYASNKKRKGKGLTPFEQRVVDSDTEAYVDVGIRLEDREKASLEQELDDRGKAFSEKKKEVKPVEYDIAEGEIPEGYTVEGDIKNIREEDGKTVGTVEISSGNIILDEDVVLAPKKESPKKEAPKEEVGVEVDDDVVYEMNKTDKKIWSKDFEILDNRQGQEEALFDEEGDKTSDKWWIVNKVTGEIIVVGTKAMAKDVIANAPAYAEAFGDGTKVEADMIVTPTDLLVEKKEAPKKEAPKKEKAPKKEAPKKPAPKKPAPKKEAPKKEAPKKEAPKKEKAPKKEAPKKEAPKKEAPKKEAPKKEAPKKEAPKKEAPKKEAPKKEAPKKDVSEEKVIKITSKKYATINETKKLISEIDKEIAGLQKEIREFTLAVQDANTDATLKFSTQDGKKLRELITKDVKKFKNKYAASELKKQGIENPTESQISSFLQGIATKKTQITKRINKRDKYEQRIENQEKKPNRLKELEDTSQERETPKKQADPAPKTEEEKIYEKAEDEVRRLERERRIEKKQYFDSIQGKKMTPLGVEIALEEIELNYDKLISEANKKADDAVKKLNKAEKDALKKKRPKKDKGQKGPKLKGVVNRELLQKQVDRAKRALLNIAPTVNIVIVDDPKTYREIALDDSNGFYDPTDGNIYINASRAIKSTVGHEVFHAILLRNGISDINARDITKRMVDTLKKSGSLPQGLINQMEAFGNQYVSSEKDAIAELKLRGINNPTKSQINKTLGEMRLIDPVFEEQMAELIGALAGSYKQLSRPQKSIVKRFLDRLAKLFGLKKFTDTEVVDLINTISRSVVFGDVISAEDVAILSKNKYIENPSQILRRKQNGGFEVIYTEYEKISQYIKDGRITEPENLEKFRGNKTAITSPDDMVVGEVYFNGEKIFEGLGGLFFVTKFGDVWAAGDKTTATKLANMINRSVKANGGKGYLTLTKGTDKKLISSAAGVNSSLGIIDVLLKQNILPKSIVRDAARKVIKEFGGGNINLAGTSKQMVSSLKEFFGDKNNATFEARGTVMERIIVEIGKDKRLGDLKKKNSKLTKILGGDPSKTLSSGTTSKTANSLVDLIALLAAEQITKGLDTGDIYAVIEVDGEVEYYPGTHPSYPAHIRQVNKKPPTLHLPKNIPAARNYLMRASDKIYKTPAVSPTEYGSFYKLEDAPQSKRKQIIGENAELSDNVRDNLNIAKQMEKAEKSAKKIRIATGWERGNDNKWRYEIDDVEITGDITAWTDEWKGVGGYVTKLTDLVSGELIDAYPELKLVKVVRGLDSSVGFGTLGQMRPTRSGWDINLSDRIFNKDVNGSINFGKSVLLHEIQHIIQDIEGFQRGGDLGLGQKLLNEKFPSEKLLNKTLASKIKEIDGFLLDDFLLSIQQYLSENPDVFDADLIAEAIGTTETKVREATNKAIEYFGDIDRDVMQDVKSKLIDELTNIKVPVSGYEVYKRISGEVEARNVQKRMGMTPKQRRETTLQETEDVAREDQILLFPDDYKDITPRKQISLEESNLNPEQYDLVRTDEFKNWFGDWENNPENASKIVDENGEPRVVYHGSKQVFEEFDPKKMATETIRSQQGPGYYFTNREKEAGAYGKVMPAFMSVKNPFIIKKKGKDISVQQAIDILSKGDYKWFFDSNLEFQTGTKGKGFSREKLIKLYAEQLHKDGDKAILKNVKRAYTPESYQNLVDNVSETLGVDGVIEEVTNRTDVYVAYQPTQVKMADGSNVTFDPMSRSMRKQKSSYVDVSMLEDMTRDGMTAEYAERGSRVERFLQKVQDKYIKVRRIGKTIEKRTGKKLESVDDFDKAETLYTGRTKEQVSKLEERFEKIIEKFASKGLTRKDVSDYLYAMHAPERNDYILNKVDTSNIAGSGMYTDINDKNRAVQELIMTQEEADSIESAQEVIKRLEDEGKIKDLESIASDIRKIQEETLERQFREGLITEETYENLGMTETKLYKHYVPLKGFKDLQSGFSDYLTGEASSTVPIKGKEILRAKGRKTAAGDVLSNIMMDSQTAVIRSNKNGVLIKLLNQLLKNPDDSIYSVYTEKEGAPIGDRKMSLQEMRDKTTRDKSSARYFKFVRVVKDGKEYFIDFKDKDMTRVINLTDGEMIGTTMNKIVDSVGKVTNIMRAAFTTMNPGFIPTNYIRDIQTGLMNALAETDMKIADKKKFIKNVSKNSVKALKTIAQEERGKTKGVDKELVKYYREFKENGAVAGYSYVQSEADISKGIDALAEGGKKNETIKSIGKFINAVNTASENSTRLAAYIEARKSGMTAEDAAYMAKNLTVNFNRSGEYNKAINTLYMFFNASVQGTVAFTKAMTTLKKEVNDDGTISTSLNYAQKVAIGIVAFSALMQMLNQGLSDEDEDGESFFDKIPEYEKERNLIIMNPANGKDYFKVPLPYGYNFFFNIGRFGYEVSNKKKSIADVSKDLVNSSVSAFSPISFSASKDVTGSFVKTATPTVAKPFMDLALNENFFKGAIYKENFPGQNKPDSSMGKQNTPEVIKEITKFINRATGGSENVKGFVDVSPETIPYIIQQYTGGAGRFISQAMNFPSKVAGGELKPREIPMFDRLYGRTSRYSDIDTYNERRDQVKSLEEEIKSGDIKRDMKVYRSAVSMSRLSKKVDKKLNELRDKKKKVAKLDSRSRQTVLIKRIEEKEDQLYDQFNKQYLKLFERYSKDRSPALKK